IADAFGAIRAVHASPAIVTVENYRQRPPNKEGRANAAKRRRRPVERYKSGATTRPGQFVLARDAASSIARLAALAMATSIIWPSNVVAALPAATAFS